MYCYNYILNSHCLTSGEKFYIIISFFFIIIVWIFSGFWIHLFPTSFHHTSCKKSTSEHIDSLLFIFSPNSVKMSLWSMHGFASRAVILTFLRSGYWEISYWSASHTRTETIYMLFLYKFRVQNQNVIVLRRANTRMYFLPERAWFGSYLKTK